MQFLEGRRNEGGAFLAANRAANLADLRETGFRARVRLGRARMRDESRDHLKDDSSSAVVTAGGGAYHASSRDWEALPAAGLRSTPREN